MADYALAYGGEKIDELLSFVDGVEYDIQTQLDSKVDKLEFQEQLDSFRQQLNSKAEVEHTHKLSDIAELNDMFESVIKFSTNETNTGQIWIDGSAIYRTVYEFGTVQGGGSVVVATNLLNINVIRIDCIGYDNDGRIIPIPFSSTNGTVSFRDIFIQTDGTLYVRCNSDANIANGHVIIEYTKL